MSSRSLRTSKRSKKRSFTDEQGQNDGPQKKIRLTAKDDHSQIQVEEHSEGVQLSESLNVSGTATPSEDTRDENHQAIETSESGTKIIPAFGRKLSLHRGNNAKPATGIPKQSDEEQACEEKTDGGLLESSKDDEQQKKPSVSNSGVSVVEQNGDGLETASRKEVVDEVGLGHAEADPIKGFSHGASRMVTECEMKEGDTGKKTGNLLTMGKSDDKMMQNDPKMTCTNLLENQQGAKVGDLNECEMTRSTTEESKKQSSVMKSDKEMKSDRLVYTGEILKGRDMSTAGDTNTIVASPANCRPIGMMDKPSIEEKIVGKEDKLETSNVNKTAVQGSESWEVAGTNVKDSVNKAEEMAALGAPAESSSPDAAINTSTVHSEPAVVVSLETEMGPPVEGDSIKRKDQDKTMKPEVSAGKKTTNVLESEGEAAKDIMDATWGEAGCPDLMDFTCSQLQRIDNAELQLMGTTAPCQGPLPSISDDGHSSASGPARKERIGLAAVEKVTKPSVGSRLKVSREQAGPTGVERATAQRQAEERREGEQVKGAMKTMMEDLRDIKLIVLREQAGPIAVEKNTARIESEEQRVGDQVKRAMKTMMEYLENINMMAGSLLSQMTQYRKHRSQRQPHQPSSFLGKKSAPLSFPCQPKGSSTSQFKKF